MLHSAPLRDRKGELLKVPDLESAIIDTLRSGQTRSLVELVAELAVPYEELKPTVERLHADGVLTAQELEGQMVYRLDPEAVSAQGPRPVLD